MYRKISEKSIECRCRGCLDFQEFLAHFEVNDVRLAVYTLSNSRTVHQGIVLKGECGNKAA